MGGERLGKGGRKRERQHVSRRRRLDRVATVRLRVRENVGKSRGRGSVEVVLRWKSWHDKQASEARRGSKQEFRDYLDFCVCR